MVRKNIGFILFCFWLFMIYTGFEVCQLKKIQEKQSLLWFELVKTDTELIKLLRKGRPDDTIPKPKS